jgi:hypothetical protein
MGEDCARLVDAICKGLATLTLVVGGFWTLYTYLVSRSDRTTALTIEAKKPFYEKRLQFYLEAVDAVATIATSSVVAEVELSKARFWKLYWGALALVEDREVESLMVEFGTCLRDRNVSEFRRLALALSHACRDSLAESWSVELSKSSVASKLLDTVKSP